jgi:para-aminobenzoate synthetase component 1
LVWNFQIYFFFNLKKYFVENDQLEMQYLSLCDEEFEEDFDEMEKLKTQNLIF